MLETTTGGDPGEPSRDLTKKEEPAKRLEPKNPREHRVYKLTSREELINSLANLKHKLEHGEFSAANRIEIEEKIRKIEDKLGRGK